jgi:anti-anti-sigma factor
VEEIKTRREGTIEVVEALGELDMSNVDLLNDALKIALSNEKTSCLLDLAGLDFLDSTVIKALVRWSNDAQLSDREALAIVVGDDTPAARLVDLLGLTGRLPIFKTGAAARTALLDGRRARDQRSLEWLTDAELNTARSDAQSDSDTVGRLEPVGPKTHPPQWGLGVVAAHQQRRERQQDQEPRADSSSCDEPVTTWPVRPATTGLDLA